MHQTICVFVLLAVAFLLNAPLAAKMAAYGNWGEAIGRLFFGPLMFFFIAHTAIYYATRFLRGPAAVATYAASRLNYIAFAISLLGLLGAAAQRVAP